MLQEGFTAVGLAKTREELLDEIVKFTKRLGFDTVTAMTVIDHFRAESEFITLDNTPPGFTEAYQDPFLSKRDPVAQHCKQHSVPILWNRDTYLRAGAADKWDYQASYGYCNGIAMALHLPEGRHFMLGVDRAAALPREPDELTRLVAELQLFAVYAQDAAFRLLLPPPLSPEAPSLTPRELESLRWTMEGKTAWEVGAILGISERTAVLHLNNATHKLDCVNKHQAVLKALRLGLIR